MNKEVHDNHFLKLTTQFEEENALPSPLLLCITFIRFKKRQPIHKRFSILCQRAKMSRLDTLMCFMNSGRAPLLHPTTVSRKPADHIRPMSLQRKEDLTLTVDIHFSLAWQYCLLYSQLLQLQRSISLRSLVITMLTRPSGNT